MLKNSQNTSVNKGWFEKYDCGFVWNEIYKKIKGYGGNSMGEHARENDYRCKLAGC